MTEMWKMGIFRSLVIWSTSRPPAAQRPEYKHKQIRQLLHWFTCTPLPSFLRKRTMHIWYDMMSLLAMPTPSKSTDFTIHVYCRDLKKKKKKKRNSWLKWTVEKSKRHTVYNQDTYVQLIILFIGWLCSVFTTDGSSRQIFLS